MGLFDDLSGTKGKQGTNGGGAASGTRPAASCGVASNISEKSKNKGSKTGKKSTNISPFSPSIGGGSWDISKTDKQAAKKTKTTAKIENMAGDVVGAGGVPVDLLPVSVDDVSRLLPSWVAAWCESQAVPDIRKASPLVFRSLCMDIGRAVKQSGILKDYTKIAAGACVGSTCNRYNPAAVVALYDVFSDFCGRCDKVPFQTTFAAFCGVSLSYIREYTHELTSSGMDIAKKTRAAEMDALRQKASVDPVGRLAILNNEYWTGGGGSDSGGGSVAQALPVEQTFGLIGTEKLD